MPRYICKIGAGVPLPIGVYNTPKKSIVIDVRQGRKCDSDRALYWRSCGWQPLQMIDLAVFIAMTRHNESINYPNGKGGDMFLEMVDDVMTIGTEAAGKKHGVLVKRALVPTRERAQ